MSGASLGALADAFGGRITQSASTPTPLARFVPVEDANANDLAPCLRRSFVDDAKRALERGASLLVASDVAPLLPEGARVWVHEHATWAMAKVLLSHARVDAKEPQVGADGALGPYVSLAPGVIVGRRVTIGASCVIGSPGFGWATGPQGETVRVPQLGGVVIEDDVSIGPLVTIDAGTLGPTVIRRGVKLDAHVHVGHNCDLGEGSIVAAQSGFAGSVRIGRGVLIGGQVGVADHVTVGDGARIAAKSGVIGDVPAGAVYAGYPAVPRSKWLRGLATVYRLLRVEEKAE